MLSASQPLGSTDNIDLGLNNSGYSAQPHPTIVKNSHQILKLTTCGLSESFTTGNLKLICENLKYPYLKRPWPNPTDMRPENGAPF